MNFENNQNAHFIMKDYFSVGQPQTFTLLLNLQRLSTVENVLWKYFYHSAFSWCTLCGFYSKVSSIRSSLSSVSRESMCYSTRLSLLSGVYRTFGRPWGQAVMVMPYREKGHSFREHSGVLDKCYKHIKIRNVNLQGFYQVSLISIIME